MRNTYLIAFVDILFCMLLIFYLMVNPEQKSKDDLLKPPGLLAVYTTWIDDGKKNDVDTWVFTPATKKPIGYDYKEDGPCNLVKDDLGTAGGTGINFENVFCREMPDGEYIINIHAFDITSLPIKVQVQIMMTINGTQQVMFDKEIILSTDSEQVTVVRFKMKNGKIDPDSINYVYTDLRD